MEGTQIGNYLIERQLGQGGFGVVYVGVDIRLGRRAAIKQLLPELSGNREIVERFFNEAKAAANINHPGIVEIYDVGWHTDGSAYFAMKLLDGDSLAKRLRSGPVAPRVAATIARQVSSALVAAHARGIVHRDLKPDNIILVPDDEVATGERATVLDFGIAKLFGDKPASQKTRTGMMMGTPAYMSPEQCRGAGEVDQRTDIYALGCIVFEMLTGRPPFIAEGAGEVLGMHLFVDPPRVRSLRDDVPAELEDLVMRALAKKPEDRMQQMSELQAALQPFAAGGRTVEHAVQGPGTEQRATPSPPDSTTPDAVSLAARAANAPPGDSTIGRSVAAPHAVSRQPPSAGTAGGQVASPLPSPAPRRRNRGIALALGGLAVVAAAIVIAVVATSSSSSSPAADAGIVRAESVADAAAVATSGDPSVDAPTALVAGASLDGGASGGAAPLDAAASLDAGCDFKEARDRANEHVTAGNDAAALVAFEAALRCKDDASAVAMAVVAACKTKNRAKATRYFARLPAAQKAKLARLCQKEGIELQPIVANTGSAGPATPEAGSRGSGSASSAGSGVPGRPGAGLPAHAKGILVVMANTASATVTVVGDVERRRAGYEEGPRSLTFDLPPGQYRVQIESAGMKAFQRSITIKAGETMNLDVNLAP